jgi:hypothetical protein
MLHPPPPDPFPPREWWLVRRNPVGCSLHTAADELGALQSSFCQRQRWEHRGACAGCDPDTATKGPADDHQEMQEGLRLLAWPLPVPASLAGGCSDRLGNAHKPRGHRWCCSPRAPRYCSGPCLGHLTRYSVRTTFLPRLTSRWSRTLSTWNQSPSFSSKGGGGSNTLPSPAGMKGLNRDTWNTSCTVVLGQSQAVNHLINPL